MNTYQQILTSKISSIGHAYLNIENGNNRDKSCIQQHQKKKFGFIFFYLFNHKPKGLEKVHTKGYARIVLLYISITLRFKGNYVRIKMFLTNHSIIKITDKIYYNLG